MSTNIVLPTLTQWTKNHITAIIEAQTQADLESAVDAFLSKNATITVNGVQISQADFVKQLSVENFAEAGATVAFSASVEVPADPKNTFDAGSVGVFYNAIISETFRIRDAPISSEVTASVNVVIAQDPSIPKPPPSPIHGFFDGRRVMALNEVRTQGAVQPQDSSA
ncbi:hypothetical protein BDZ97DRAFT_1439176 [Flammula alnicola]|nr:hypothetical protein BDZ97DRAFT_1439176 [Flammula alnicola]